MARMYSDDERKSVNYGDSLQLTNWIFDLGATCHMRHPIVPVRAPPGPVRFFLFW